MRENADRDLQHQRRLRRPDYLRGADFRTAEAQVDAAWAQLTSAQRSALVFGVRHPSAIEKAVGARAGTAPWQARITATMTDTFADGTWALSWLGVRQPRPTAKAG